MLMLIQLQKCRTVRVQKMREKRIRLFHKCERKLKTVSLDFAVVEIKCCTLTTERTEYDTLIHVDCWSLWNIRYHFLDCIHLKML